MSDYAYTTLDDPFAGNFGTAAHGINNAGQIVGSYAGHGFLYSGGTYTTLDYPAMVTTDAAAINNAGQIVGSTHQILQIHPSEGGYLYSGGTWTSINDPMASGFFSTHTNAYGLNDAGVIVGDFLASDNMGSFNSHGFIYNNGSYATQDVPSATNTHLASINNFGQIVGNSSNGAFLYSGGIYTTIMDPLGATSATGINGFGQIVGYYTDGSQVAHGFLFSGGSYITIDDPLASPAGFGTGTFAEGINDNGQIVGYYTDGNGVKHGFLANATTTAVWANGVSGDFGNPANWTPAIVPGPSSDVAISPSGTYTVTSLADRTINSLSTAAGATLAITAGTFTIDNGTGSGANAGTLMVGAGGTLHVIGQIAGSGAVVINGGTLDLAGSYAGVVTFTGPGGTFVGDAGNHNLVGDGAGNTLDYSNATSPVQFNLTTGFAYNNLGGSAVGVDHFFNMSFFKGGSSNDTFIGGPGNHTFIGDGGLDTLDYSSATTGAQFDLTANKTYNNLGGGPTVWTDQFSGIGIFKGGSGNDVFIGGPGNHTIDGGSGIDTLDYSAATTAVQFDFASGFAYNNFGGGPTAGVDHFSNIYVFKGGSGIDTFFGGPGNHTVDGGPGGPNILDYSAATTGVEFNVATGMAYNNFTNLNVTVDHFFGVAIFKGGSGGSTFLGGPGNNVFAGGAGTDTLDYSATSAPVSINLGTGAAMNGYGGTDHWASIEVFKGGSGHDDFLATNAPGTYSFVGGGSADTFSFGGMFGHGTIANFASGPDHIYLDHNEFADFAAVQSHAQQVGTDTVITYDANDTITLQNTMPSNLHAGDFLFL